MRYIRAMYYDNIHPKIREGQAKALAALGHEVRQDNAAGTLHFDWIAAQLDALGDDDSILFLDIDCIPLNRTIIERAFAAAEGGRIFGAAQAASHVDPGFVYAGPMFLALSRRTWDRLGRPSLKSDAHFDSAGALTDAANRAGVGVELIFPSDTLLPKWPMADRGCFGIGTFYEGHIFHLFEAHAADGYTTLFVDVANAVAAGRPIDYLALHRKARSLPLRLAKVRGHLLRRLARLQRRMAEHMPGFGHRKAG